MKSGIIRFPTFLVIYINGTTDCDHDDSNNNEAVIMEDNRIHKLLCSHHYQL